MEYHVVFKKTLREFIAEIDDILKSARYDVPEIIITDLQMADITVAASTPEIIMDIMTTFGKFVIQFEKEIAKKDLIFFNRLSVCKACTTGNKTEKCICVAGCIPTATTSKNGCKCDAKCPNCSELLTSLDSKTFNAIKYIVGQAVEDLDDPDKKEDLDVIFGYISSLLAAAKNHKKR